jgi:hypothetical protein
MKRLIRHPPDDGVVGGETITFAGFWQYETRDNRE